MEKTFLRMKARPSARHAYLEAELVTGLAHQIRAVRMQRHWTQSDLAKRLGTTQPNVARLEDPSYGRYTLATLIELAKVFDTGMQVRFISFISMLNETFKPSAKAREVLSFDEEAPTVDFFRGSSLSSISQYIPVSLAPIESSVPYIKMEIPRRAEIQPISVNI